MDFEPVEDHEALRKGIRELVARFDDDYWSACDAEHRFPDEFYATLADGGWLGVEIPEEYGGAGLGITEAALLLQEIATSGAAMNGCSAIHLTLFGMNPVVKHGSPELRSLLLPRVAAGDLHVSFGVTEPDAGTDTSRITTGPVVTVTTTSSTAARCGSRRRSRPSTCCSSRGPPRSTSARSAPTA